MIRVAIVDDHVIVRTGLRYLIDSDPELEFAGEFGGGVGAADFVAAVSPDVTLLDVRMPDRGGIEVLHEIRAGYVMKDSPIATIRAAIRSAMAGEVFMTEDVRRIYETRKGAKGLSVREAEALTLAAKGAGNREIATAMSLSENSVKMFLKRAFYKLGATNRAEAVQLAVRRGLINAE